MGVPGVTTGGAAEAALRRLVDEHAALRRVATAVAAETDPAELFGLVTREAGQLMGARSANLVRYDGGALASVIGGWNADGAQSVPTGEVVRVDGDTATARVLRTGRPARIDSYDGQSGPLIQSLRELGLSGAIAAPIVLAGRLWGAIVLSSLIGTPPFERGAEHQIADFGALLAQALANAQTRAELAASRARLVEAADAERRRLERNLHDGAQQRLVSLALTLRLAARRLGDDAELLRAGVELDLALAELRELARGIHPVVLSEFGLEPAIRGLAGRAPVPVEVELTLAERLPAAVEAGAYYVIAEALTNIAKHAQASFVRVSVRESERGVCVQVTDDGIGGADGAGSGLRGLADRVEALGGRLALDSRAGTGTTLRAHIPLA